MTADKPTRSSRHGAATLIVALVVLALVAGGWFLAASAAYRRSFSATTLKARTSSADLATRMAPWSGTYAKRALVLDNWLRGADALARGDYNGAIVALDIAYRNDIGDSELLALYHKAQDVQALATNRKAHLQHGHEGPGGTLAPQQVER